MVLMTWMPKHSIHGGGRRVLRRFKARYGDARRRRGFTLIEYLAVVALLAIVGSLALAQATAAIERTRNARAIDEIARIHHAVEQYRTLSGGNLPLRMTDMIPAQFDAPPLDPWGTPYVYHNFTRIPPWRRRKDGPLVPINREYDIFSRGPNRVSTPNIRSAPGRDDIILADEGGFIDVAAKY